MYFYFGNNCSWYYKVIWIHWTTRYVFPAQTLKIFFGSIWNTVKPTTRIPRHRLGYCLGNPEIPKRPIQVSPNERRFNHSFRKPKRSLHFKAWILLKIKKKASNLMQVKSTERFVILWKKRLTLLRRRSFRIWRRRWRRWCIKYTGTQKKNLY